MKGTWAPHDTRDAIMDFANQGSEKTEIALGRFIVHREIREQMTERDIETIVQRAREAFPHARPRIISDNGPQFIAKDFKEFIRQCGMTHVKTSPHYPQSNGKIERWHQSLKCECIRPGTPLSLEDARRLVGEYVAHYNYVSYCPTSLCA